MRAPREYERRDQPVLPPELVEGLARDGALWQWRKPPPLFQKTAKTERRPWVVGASVMRAEDYELQRGLKALVWMLAWQLNPFPIVQQASTPFQSTGTLDQFFGNGLYQQGDIAICFVQSANQAVAVNNTNGWIEYTGPGGTTFPAGAGTAGTADSSRLSVFWTRVTNKPNTSDTHVQFTDPGDHVCSIMMVVRGALEWGNPFDTASSTTGTGTAVTIPQVTTSVANCLGLAVGTCGGTGTRTFGSWTNSFTEQTEFFHTAGVDGGISVATKLLTSSGATGSVGVTISSTGTTHAAGLVAVLPAISTTHNMPQHIGAGALQTSTTGSITYPIPAVCEDYDVILLRVQSANEAVVLTTAQGFVEVTNQGTGTANAIGSTRMTIFWRRVGSGEAGTIGDVVIQASADHLIAGMHVYRHCKRTGDPWDTFAGDVEATGSTSVTFPSVTTSVDDCLVLCYGAHAVDSSAGQFGNLTNSNLTYIVTRSTSSTTNGVGGGQAVYSSWKYSAGSTGTSTCTLTTSSKQARITIALLPEPETDWEEDPTSGKGVPRTLGQWSNVLDAALGAHTKLPTSVYTFQEPADDIRDAVSTAAAFANSGAGFTYLSATTGWSRSGLLFTEASANKLTATIPAADSNSFLCLFYVAITATPGASARHVIHHPNLIVAVNTTPVYQAVDPAAANPTLSGTQNPGTAVHPVWLRSNRTANTLSVITDQETINAVNFEDTLTTLILGSNSSVNAPMRVLYGARWTGTAAEMSDSDIAAINATLGWGAAGTGSSAGTSTVTGVGTAVTFADGSSAGTCTTAGVGTSTAASASSSTGTSTASAVGSSTAASTGSSTGSVIVAAVGASTAASTGSAAGTCTATAVGASFAASVGSSTGTSTVTGVGRSTAASVGSSAGVATVTGVGSSTAASVGSSTGTSTVAAVGTAVLPGVGSSSGTSTVTGTGSSTATAVGSSTGSSTVTGTGVSTAASVGSSTGTSTVTGTGISTAASTGATSGIATATGVATSRADTVGSSSGTSTGNGIGISTAEAVGSSTGAVTVTGIITTLVDTTGTSAGTSTVTGVGAFLTAAVGLASGTSTATSTASSTAASIGSSTGSATATGTISSTAEAVGVSSGTAVDTGVGTAIHHVIGSSSGISTVAGEGRATYAGTGACAGTSTPIGIGASTAAAIATCSGSSAVAATGSSTAASAGISSGLATANATASSTAASIGNASGICTAVGIAISTAEAIGSSNGVSAPVGIGAATFSGVGATTCSSSVSGGAAAIVSGAGASSCLASVSAVGAATFSAAGLCNGQASVAATMAATVAAIGSCNGVSVASGALASTTASVGSATCTSTVTGILTQIVPGFGIASGSASLSSIGIALSIGQGNCTANSNVSAVGRANAAAKGLALGKCLSEAQGYVVGYTLEPIRLAPSTRKPGVVVSGAQEGSSTARSGRANKPTIRRSR